MRSTSKQLEFIRLKAEGKSNAQIARILHISESTASRYTKLLEDKISQYKAEQLQELYQAYHMTREARIRNLGKTLERIDTALEENDLKPVPLEKLLDMKLKYTTALKREFIPLGDEAQPANEAAELTVTDLLGRMNCLLSALKTGDIAPEQAGMEIKILKSILKGYETVVLEERMTKLEEAMMNRRNTE